MKLKSLVFAAAVSIFSLGAAAETVTMQLKIENLSATFAEEADGSYSVRSAKVDCMMKVKGPDVNQEVDCSAQTSVAEGATLTVKKKGNKIQIQMSSTDADGNTADRLNH